MAGQINGEITGIAFVTAEIISGVRAVGVNQSGAWQVAMSSVSGRMPAAAIAVGNALSGQTVQTIQIGGFQFGSGMGDFSGYIGRRVWVGRSGQIVQWSGSFNSGGFGSGDNWQPVGVICNSGAVWFNTQPFLTSGATNDLIL